MAFFCLQDFIAGLCLLPFISLSFPQTIIPWIIFIFVIFSAFITDYFSALALQNTGVSIYQIVAQVRHILALVLGMILFSEPIMILKVVGIGFIVLGVIIALFQRQKNIFDKGFYYSLISTLGAVAIFVFYKYALEYFEISTLASLALIGASFIGLGTLKFNVKSWKDKFVLNRSGVIFSSIAFALFLYCLLSAIKTGEISRVIPVNQGSLIFAVLMEMVFLKERDHIVRKLIGVTLIMGGIFLMN